MATHQSQFLPKLSLLQMKERTISSLLAEPPITGIHALMYYVLVELRRLYPEVMPLTDLGCILRPPSRVVGMADPGLKGGLHALVYGKVTPKSDRQKLEMELTAAFGAAVEPCYEYLNVWLDLYLSLLEIVVQTQQFFRGDADKLVAYGKRNPLPPSVARGLLMTSGTLRGLSVDRFATMLIATVHDQGSDVPPIPLHRLQLWKNNYAAVDEYLTLYRKALKQNA